MDSITKNKYVIIIVSLIWGFGIALMFRRICQNERCIIVKVPPSFNDKQDVLRDGQDRCFRLKKYPASCTY